MIDVNDGDIKREWQLIMGQEYVDIEVPVSWKYGFCLPDENGTEKVVARFKTMTCEDFWSSEGKASVWNKLKNREVDYQQFRLNILKELLIKITTFAIDRDDLGNMTEESFMRLINLPAPLISTILSQYEAKYVMVNEIEESEINRQANILFGKSSRGVENACEAVSLYCTLGNFWEKFGLNRFDLKKLPYKEFLRLRAMVSKDSSIHQAEMNKDRAKSRVGKRGSITVPDHA